MKGGSKVEETILKAEIKAKFSIVLRLILGLLISMAVIFCCPVSQRTGYEFYNYGGVSVTGYACNIFEDDIFEIEGNADLFSDEIDMSKIHLCIGLDTFTKFDPWYIAVPIYCAVLIWIIMLITSNVIKKSSIRLDQNGLNGNKKTLFGNNSFNIPIEEIHNIKVKKGFIDIFLGGKTFEVIAQSGVARFRCVRNADDLKYRTLELKNKES